MSECSDWRGMLATAFEFIRNSAVRIGVAAEDQRYLRAILNRGSYREGDRVRPTDVVKFLVNWGDYRGLHQIASQALSTMPVPVSALTDGGAGGDSLTKARDALFQIKKECESASRRRASFFLLPMPASDYDEIFKAVLRDVSGTGAGPSQSRQGGERYGKPVTSRDRLERQGRAMTAGQSMIPAERIERSILLIRGEKVMLDADLAALYGVSTGRLNEAVKRNIGRFPDDFMFQLTPEEGGALRSQIATLKSMPRGRGRHRKYAPYAFTEQGVAMLSSVLRSERAVRVNVEIMRAFVRLRRILASHADLARKLDALERKYDAQFKVVFDAIRQLMEPPPTPKKGRIGFNVQP